MPPLLSIRGLSKSFGAARALKPLDLEVATGEIVGLVGENGAGKSTLIKLLSGVHVPDVGEIALAGRPVRFSSPREALASGIATIHQELEGFGRLTVAENMLMGERWPRRWWGAIDWSRLYAEAERRLAEFGADIDPRAQLDDLTPAQKQEVSIATALALKARLLILDEPTASLSEPEVERLEQRLKQFRQQGVGVIYVSHRLDEIFALTDRVVVLRDGELAASAKTAELDVQRLIEAMVGRPLDQVYPRTRPALAEQTETPALLEVRNASRGGMFADISLSIRPGEIVGLGGLVGAGRSELARALYGLYPLDAGELRWKGQTWTPRHPRKALARGLVYVPEERKRQGFVLDQSIRDSISIGFTDELARLGIINQRRELETVRMLIETYDVRGAERAGAIGALSGGNQQKALLARWLERRPELIILDEPTRGVDVGAKAQIHGIIDQLAGAGRGVLLISSDLPELLGMSDRILVMNRGRIETELRGAAMTERNVVLAASGLYEPTAAGRSA
jgi:ABC-type sugar transport system ATPase subunit